LGQPLLAHALAYSELPNQLPDIPTRDSRRSSLTHWRRRTARSGWLGHFFRPCFSPRWPSDSCPIEWRGRSV